MQFTTAVAALAIMASSAFAQIQIENIASFETYSNFDCSPPAAQNQNINSNTCYFLPQQSAKVFYLEKTRANCQMHFPASSAQSSTQIGKLVFPYYNPDINDPSDTKWMKRVYMYVGKGQRMTGECKKLPKPIAIVRKKGREAGEDVDMGGTGAENEGEVSKDEELEICEVVKYRIVFSARPEPISGVAEASDATKDPFHKSGKTRIASAETVYSISYPNRVLATSSQLGSTCANQVKKVRPSPRIDYRRLVPAAAARTRGPGRAVALNSR
ncbi:hypothetical protein yc1106_08401 [Curvularia clavata]|uniref:Uncharacterized protein n=1 Tax=Curvularia clavata TaxID=95742 RepID=A0A9Q9DVR4_CURCL|nr:hypothetical protein yc1106_08401 [Curvularia clavata]